MYLPAVETGGGGMGRKSEWAGGGDAEVRGGPQRNDAGRGHQRWTYNGMIIALVIADHQSFSETTYLLLDACNCLQNFPQSLTERLLRMKCWDSDLEDEEGGEKEATNETPEKDEDMHLQKVQKLIFAAKVQRHKYLIFNSLEHKMYVYFILNKVWELYSFFLLLIVCEIVLFFRI